MKAGDFIIYVDKEGNKFNSLVTDTVLDPNKTEEERDADESPNVNLVTVNAELSGAADEYGAPLTRYRNVIFAGKLGKKENVVNCYIMPSVKE
jgi:hypothetical protein